MADLVDSPADAQALNATSEPQRIRLTCHNVLAARGDAAGAARWLTQAHAELETRAARLATPALRERFRAAFRHHRDIVAAWDAMRAASG
jgi:hypothetical protein